MNFAFYLFIPSAPGIVLQHLQTSNSFRKVATSNHANFRCLDLTKTNFSKLKYFCKAADAAICQNIALQGGCHNFFAWFRVKTCKLSVECNSLKKTQLPRWLVNKMSSIEWSRHFLKELIYWASWVEFLEIDEWTRVNWNNFLCSKNTNLKIRKVKQFSFAAIYEYGTRFSKLPYKLLPILKSILSQLGKKIWHQISTFSFC